VQIVGTGAFDGPLGPANGLGHQRQVGGGAVAPLKERQSQLGHELGGLRIIGSMSGMSP
jgi:hypothetical protein